MTELVSIITPSFNQARFLRVCIDSVARQSYRVIEQIVCDGGSTDQTVEVLRSSPDSVRWVSEPDGGQADAVNKGFAMSSGEIVGWINSDDALFSTDAIATVVNAFRDPKVDAVCGQTALVAEDGLIVRHSRSFVPSGGRIPRMSSPISQPALFFRRSLLEARGSVLDVDLHAALDLDLVLGLVRDGARIELINDVLVIDRDHSQRKQRLLTETYRAESAKVMARHGFRCHPILIEKFFAWGRRLRGVSDVIRWNTRYVRASDWYTDALATRLLRQVAVPHYQLVGPPTGPARSLRGK